MDKKSIRVAELVRENILKNVLVIIVVLIVWPTIVSRVSTITNDGYTNFLTMISILLVTVCFANFAFSYQSTYIHRLSFKLIAHTATFLFLLLTALLLIMMTEIIKVAYPETGILVEVFSLLLYFSVVLYDFWDLLKIAE